MKLKKTTSFDSALNNYKLFKDFMDRVYLNRAMQNINSWSKVCYDPILAENRQTQRSPYINYKTSSESFVG